MVSIATSRISVFPISLKQGADQTVSMVWSDDSGNPMNLTGYSMRLQIRPTRLDGPPLLTLDSSSGSGSRIAIDATSGTIDLIFARADTAVLLPTGLLVPGAILNGPGSFQIGVYDLQYTDQEGNVGYLLQGAVSLDPRVTV